MSARDHYLKGEYFLSLAEEGGDGEDQAQAFAAIAQAHFAAALAAGVRPEAAA